MHSAKRGLAIACRLSVRPSLSVTLVDCECDHIGWNSSEIISPLVSLHGMFALCRPKQGVILQGKHQEILAQSDPPPVDLSVGEHSIANCGRMVTDRATVTMESL